VLPEKTRLRREELLAGLRELFLREGFAGLGVGELAARLRCSRTTLYLVAPSKEQIVVATVRSYFKNAAERVEARVAACDEPGLRLATYLEAVASELQPASEAFYTDLAGFAPANEVYQANTGFAAQRVQQLVVEGVEAGALRPVNASFVGAAVAQVMSAIQTGEIEAATGLADAEAYRQLADLVLAGLA
jgi:AcrR family transcriptional regulator